MNETIWNNKHILIENKPIYIPNWEHNGIKKLNHIVNRHGNFKSKAELEFEFNMNIDIMKYIGIKCAIPNPWRMKIKEEGEYEDKPNVLMVKINNVEKDIKDLRCKDYYWEYISKYTVKPTALDRWEELYYYIDFNWQNIFTLPYLVARETKLQSLQFQILNRYFPCKRFLYKCNKVDTDRCNHCPYIDDLEHFFVSCSIVKPFWKDFNKWFANLFETKIYLHSPDILFGIPIINDNDIIYILNFCILFAKSFIHSEKMKEDIPSFHIFRNKLKDRLIAEKFILQSQNKLEVFDQKWGEVLTSLI